MKILHVLAQLPARTGSGVYFSAVIDEFKKFGHEQRAVFAVQDQFNFDILKSCDQYPVHFKSEKLTFPIAGMSDIMPYENSVYSKMSDEMLRLWRLAFEKVLNKANDEFAPDVVLLHHLWLLTSMGADIFSDKIKIGVCHNTDIRQAQQHPEMKYRYVTNLNKLDMVLSLSENQKQMISDTFSIEKKKIVAVGGGFNQKLFYPPLEKKKNKKVQIVYSAKIEKSKGVFELIKAFRQLEKSNIHLDIIGVPNSENARTMELFIGEADNISVIPITNQRELADYIRNKDIFVMPSYFEGLGLMAIECLACGLRVVATEIEALISLLGNDVNNSGIIEYVTLPRIYDTDKPYEEDLEEFTKNLASKLLVQIERVEHEEKMPANLLNEINKHSWAGVSERIYALIMKLF